MRIRVSNKSGIVWEGFKHEIDGLKPYNTTVYMIASEVANHGKDVKVGSFLGEDISHNKRRV